MISWRVACWITNHAMAPLVTVTGELRRFASGDFSPRTVDSSERAELGYLIESYNSAAAQVAAAFAERTRVDEQMRRFVADAGHELRTPLTVIAGYVDILKAGGADEPAIRDGALNTLALETHRMRALVERLMALARLERPDAAKAVVVNVEALAARVISHVTAARGGNVALDSDAVVTVIADPAEPYEAINNLVENALKYGEATPVRVKVGRSNGTVTVRVHDGGPGIPEGERSHIFERFYRGEGRGDVDGSGLGLAIVERAVARCGGRVRDSSAPILAIRRLR
jgi:two-component system OmpR family sensor kinase